MPEPLWTPSRRRVVSSNLYSFLVAMRARYDIPDGEYATLHRWSIDNLETFWEAIRWELSGFHRCRGGHRSSSLPTELPPQPRLDRVLPRKVDGGPIDPAE